MTAEKSGTTSLEVLSILETIAYGTHYRDSSELSIVIVIAGYCPALVFDSTYVWREIISGDELRGWLRCKPRDKTNWESSTR